MDFQFQHNDDRHKITVWMGLMGNGNIIGSFFFEINDDDGYLQMINQQVVPALQRMRHFSPNRNGRFERLCGEDMVALNHSVEWPPRSPDLTPLDFFLWGYLKSKVYVTPPATLANLRKRISHEMGELEAG